MVVNTELGLCTSPAFAQTAVSLNNPPFIRSILYSLKDAEYLKSLGKPLIITLNNECKEVGSDWSGWDDTVSKLAKMLKNQLLVLGCGNEFDIYWDRSEQQDMYTAPMFASSLAIRASRICHQYNIKVSPTSVAGANWPAYLEQLNNLCNADVDYFDIHPYGKQPSAWGESGWGFGWLSDALHQVTALTGKPTICTEYGVKIQDAGGEEEVASFMYAAYNTLSQMGVPYCGWFASEDAVGAPDERGGAAFGLISEHGDQRPAYFEYSKINPQSVSEPMPEPEPLVPTIDYTIWHDKVGDGLLEMMKADNVAPVMASEWRPFDRPKGVPATVEECIASDGSTYRWLLPTNSGYKLKPSK